MRLVLLPGLNGSSKLFAPLLAQLQEIPQQIIELPGQGPQDYTSLANAVAEQLPVDNPFVLLGESFSDPLAHHLALQSPKGLKGLIFAASFLQSPHPLAVLASRLPLPKMLLSHSWALRLFCIGNAQPAILQLLQKEIRDMPSALIKARLRNLAELSSPEQKIVIPALHLWPTRDRLVSHTAAASLASGYSDLRHESIEGPHFLLQSRPQACAMTIRNFIEQLKD
ncbi:alpha/beta fold hydrolase [Aquipseudomonas alcaligenes]|uniref:alpha/beta fold hydrolase n=1 Tax=Aquipseudomonas alcaligenes TaxID=43263 RepID=UPI0035AFE9D1